MTLKMTMRGMLCLSSILSLAAAGGVSTAGCASGEAAFEELRYRMVREQIIARGIEDEAVVRAMREVPRHMFVPQGMQSMAYIDSPLPIGSNQTISQPYIVGLMTSALDPEPGDRVLEIGTGSGYQAAVLAAIVDSVFTIEILPELASRAGAVLDSLGYGNARVRTGDGYYGWPSKAPFNGVIVTAAAPKLPDPLIEQLEPGGRLVIPVGRMNQELRIYEKLETGGLELRATIPVRFVPMTGRIREN